MNHIALPVLVGLLIFGTPVLAARPGECPRISEGDRLAYSTLYPGGSVRCTYVPNILGLARREV